MNLKKIGRVVTSKFVGTGPSSYKNRNYRAAVSQRLRNTDVRHTIKKKHLKIGYKSPRKPKYLNI